MIARNELQGETHRDTQQRYLRVIAKAQEVNAILLSLNGDFADIVTYPPKNYERMVALRMRDHSEILPHLSTRLTAYLKLQSTMEHSRGKLLGIEVDRIRNRE